MSKHGKTKAHKRLTEKVAFKVSPNNVLKNIEQNKDVVSYMQKYYSKCELVFSEPKKKTKKK